MILKIIRLNRKYDENSFAYVFDIFPSFIRFFAGTTSNLSIDVDILYFLTDKLIPLTGFLPALQLTLIFA